MHTFREHIDAAEFVIIGHRGAAGLAPENTLESFRTALLWNCPLVELDVYACTNNSGASELLVIHDDKLNRTTNGRGRVMDHTVEQLRQLDAGDGQRIPLLEEVINLLRTHNEQHPGAVGVNIELKGPATAAPTAAAIEDMADIPILVSSFNHDELARFHELAPQCAVAPLYDRYRPDWHETAAALTAIAVNISRRIADVEHIAAIRQAGYEVFVYTVNTVEEAQALKQSGASGVFTDRPDLLIHLT